jgi:hypothetical protein
MKVCDICKSPEDVTPVEIKTVRGDAMGELCDPCTEAVHGDGFPGAIRRAVESAPPARRRRSSGKKSASDGAG